MHFNTKNFFITYILSTHKSSDYHSLNNHILQQVDCSPYLGVTLTHDLRWMTCINITRKASSTPSCRKTAYISLVCSSLEDSAVVWDPYQQNDIDKLENIQRCATRFINHNYKDCTPGCVTNMLRCLGLQSLHQPQVQRPHCWMCHQHAERCCTAVASE